MEIYSFFGIPPSRVKAWGQKLAYVVVSSPVSSGSPKVCYIHTRNTRKKQQWKTIAFCLFFVGLCAASRQSKNKTPKKIENWRTEKHFWRQTLKTYNVISPPNVVPMKFILKPNWRIPTKLGTREKERQGHTLRPALKIYGALRQWWQCTSKRRAAAKQAVEKQKQRPMRPALKIYSALCHVLKVSMGVKIIGRKWRAAFSRHCWDNSYKPMKILAQTVFRLPNDHKHLTSTSMNQL